MRTILQTSWALGLLIVVGCKPTLPPADAYGNFATTEITLSAETTGKIIKVLCNEGEKVTSGAPLLIIDTLQQSLKLQELQNRQVSVEGKLAQVHAQTAVYKQQQENLLRDKKRIEQMLVDGAATQKQMDDIDGQIDVLEQQIRTVETNRTIIGAEMKAMQSAMDQVRDLIDRACIKAPVDATVLQRYAEKGELVAPGKALIKLADLSVMELKAYISSNQLSEIKINGPVEVAIDQPDGQLKKYPGRISWIASEAEFTPKNIQTREERISQVYAIKVMVSNDGYIKINMPGEVFFHPSNEQ